MTRLPERDIVPCARLLATLAHRGQVDKAGRDYIAHPAQVAAALDDPEAVAAAWLHDTVEDTWVDLDMLRAIGFPPKVVAAVDAVTKRPGESYTDAIARAAADPIGARVKRADIASNADPDRLAALDPATRDRLARKYACGLALLDELTGSCPPR